MAVIHHFSHPVSVLLAIERRLRLLEQTVGGQGRHLTVEHLGVVEGGPRPAHGSAPAFPHRLGILLVGVSLGSNAVRLGEIQRPCTVKPIQDGPLIRWQRGRARQ